MGINRLKILKILASHVINSGDSVDMTSGIKWLQREGFSADEIEEACAWLKNLTLNGDLCMALKDCNGDFYKNRVLNTTESLKINEDAYGFLIRLKEMGLIDRTLQEEIIEIAMLAADDEIGMDDIKGITAMVIFDHSPSQWKSDIMNIINDRWERVYH